MAAGLRDVLALQGVIPTSASAVTSTAGGNLGFFKGEWVGAAPTGVTTAGGNLGFFKGEWVGAAPIVTPGGDPGFISWLPMAGVWISGSLESTTPTDDVREGGAHSREHGAVAVHHQRKKLQKTADIRRLALLAVTAIDEFYD